MNNPKGSPMSEQAKNGGGRMSYIPKCDQCGRFTTNPETEDAYQPGPGSEGPNTTRLCDSCEPTLNSELRVATSEIARLQEMVAQVRAALFGPCKFDLESDGRVITAILAKATVTGQP